jgi:hypothetical protein
MGAVSCLSKNGVFFLEVPKSLKFSGYFTHSCGKMINCVVSVYKSRYRSCSKCVNMSFKVEEAKKKLNSITDVNQNVKEEGVREKEKSHFFLLIELHTYIN